MSNETALAPLEPTTLVVRPMTGDELGQQFLAYRELQAAIDRALPDAMETIGGRQFRTKPYWRALGRAMRLAVECVEERREVIGQFHDGTDIFGYCVLYQATLGQQRVVGDGACFASEKAEKFKCPHPAPGRGGNWREHYPPETCPDYDPGHRWRETPPQATEHNVRSHAHTRAFNRAISNLVGFGEVSAEEVTREDEPPFDDEPRRASRSSAPPRPVAARPAGPAVISSAQVTRFWTVARQKGWSDDAAHAVVTQHSGVESVKHITRDTYDAIIAVLEQGPKQP